MTPDNPLEGFSCEGASRLIPEKAHPNISKNSWDMVVCPFYGGQPTIIDKRS
jgi:hypothetical protein